MIPVRTGLEGLYSNQIICDFPDCILFRIFIIWLRPSSKKLFPNNLSQVSDLSIFPFNLASRNLYFSSLIFHLRKFLKPWPTHFYSIFHYPLVILLSRHLAELRWIFFLSSTTSALSNNAFVSSTFIHSSNFHPPFLSNNHYNCRRSTSV